MNNFEKSLVLGLIIRLGIIIYGEWHDKNFPVPFTDVDYKVFTDAARYVSQGESPYKRHTYRYPPILAWLLVPNVIFASWGKVLFSTIDLFTSILIKNLVELEGFSDKTGIRCAQFWIFNPLSIIISTRGNSEAIISLIVLFSAYFLLKDRPIFAGMFLAFSIHLRLYPIVFSLPMYLSLKPEDNSKTFSERILNSSRKLYPNRSQLLLALSCIFFLTVLTVFCYYLYGNEFLQESLLYHLTRRDTRHNFSIYFYLLYLKPNQPSLLLFLPQLVLLVILSLVYGRKSTLLFCLFTQTFVVVSYNPVITSQYFIWYLSLLTPNLTRFNITLFEAVKITGTWIFSQISWLIPAYFLEYRAKNTFLFIWFQGIGFFCANMGTLVKLIRCYSMKPGNYVNKKSK